MTAPHLPEDDRREYRVVWQREGMSRRVRSHDTLAEAEAQMERVVRNQQYMVPPVPAFTFGPVVEERVVGPWRVSS